MSFEDQKIIMLRNEEKKKLYNSIEKGIYIEDELIFFKEFILFDDKISIKLPLEYFDMPMDLAKKKYPCEDRPQIIKTNSDGSVNFTFSLIEQLVSSEQLNDIIKDFHTLIQKAYPSDMFFESDFLDSFNSKIAWMSFKGSSLNGSIYNILFITDIDNKLLLGMFNCKFELWNIWKPVVIEILNSLNDLSKGE